MPRAPHLQSTAAARTLDLDRDVVRVDLGPDAVEQDPPLAPDRRRRCIRVAAPQQQLGERLDDRAAVLAADLLAALGDRQRGGEDRLGSLVSVWPVANSDGNIDPPRIRVGRSRRS